MGMFDKLVRADILNKKPYMSFRVEHHEQSIWLNANENPWNPCAEMDINRYPEFQPYRLREKFAELYGVENEQILLTRGSDEAIEILIRTICRPGKDKIMVCPPTFAMFEINAILHDVSSVRVPLIKEKNFALDVDAVLKACNEEVKLVFLVSPNNPTGNLLNEADVLAVIQGLDQKAIVVVDEAYIEFAHTDSMTQHLSKHTNLVILRTLSKAHGMAGARCGAAIAHSELIQIMRRVVSPFPIPMPVEEIVLKTLNAERMQKEVSILLEERDKLIPQLESLACIKKIWPSDANFVLVEVECADDLIQACRLHGIELRNRTHIQNCKDCIRISVGSPEQNQQLIEALKNVKA